jgi:hypothetical protein
MQLLVKWDIIRSQIGYLKDFTFQLDSVPCRQRGADKSLARPTSRCILFDGENISFDANLVMYINSTNVSQIMIINRIYEHQNILSLIGLRTYSAPLYIGADKSLARTSSRYILFDGEIISFDASLVV